MADSPFLRIQGGRLLDPVRGSAEAADLLIEGRTIVAVGPPGLAAPAGARTLDARGRLLHPGLVNAHTHGHGNLAKGFGERWTLELLLAAATWTVGGQTAEDRYNATLLGAAEMALKGCTACYDLTVELPGPSVDGLLASARAYDTVGLRAVIAPMVSNIPFFDAIPGLRGALPPALAPAPAPADARTDAGTLAELRRALHTWPFDREQLRLAVAPTIAHHCTDGFLADCARLAADFDVGLHSHVQESKVQAVTCVDQYGQSQVAHLESLGLLGPRFTAAHGVWLSADDMARLGRHGCSVAHNPGSNMRLGNGLADVRGMLDAGINVALGTDGAHCSDNLNMYESMRLASMTSSVQRRPVGRWLRSAEVVAAATTAGARCLGWGDSIGRIAPGFQADIVFLDLGHVNWLPLNDALNQLVHSEDGNAVHSVMVGGRLIVENRRLLTLDMQDLARRVEASRDRLEAKVRPHRQLFTAIGGVVDGYCAGLAARPYADVDRYVGHALSHACGGAHPAPDSRIPSDT